MNTNQIIYTEGATRTKIQIRGEIYGKIPKNINILLVTGIEGEHIVGKAPNIENFMFLQRVELRRLNIPTLKIKNKSIGALIVNYCNVNEVASLPPNLNILCLSNNNITRIDLSPYPLKTITIESNRLSRIILPQTSEKVNLNDNLFVSFNFSLPHLIRLDIVCNTLETIDVSLCPLLSFLNINNNELYSIKLPEHLRYLYMDDNFMQYLDLHNTKIEELSLNCNPFISISLPRYLQTLDLDGIREYKTIQLINKRRLLRELRQLKSIGIPINITPTQLNLYFLNSGCFVAEEKIKNYRERIKIASHMISLYNVWTRWMRVERYVIMFF